MSAWPATEGRPPGGETNPWALDDLTLVVGRALGTVVVTVDGALTPAGSELLEAVLIDLIEGQGNRSVAVDLGTTVVDPVALPVLADAARRARQLGTRFIVKAPPAEAKAAMQHGELAGVVEIQPRRGG